MSHDTYAHEKFRSLRKRLAAQGVPADRLDGAVAKEKRAALPDKLLNRKCPKCGGAGAYYQNYSAMMDQELTPCEECKRRYEAAEAAKEMK